MQVSYSDKYIYSFLKLNFYTIHLINEAILGGLQWNKKLKSAKSIKIKEIKS